MDLSFILSSGSEAAEKFTGDASRAGDLTDEDLETGERDLDDSLVSSNPLTLLTGVLTHLTGVLGRLSGVLDGVSDLLGVVSSLGTGTVDCAAGLAWASGAIPWSIHRCSKVHMDIKSINIAWLIEVGIDGKSGLLTPVKMEASCPPDGIVPAGVPWAAGPSNTTDWWRAGLSESAGSSNWSAEPSVDVCLRNGSSHLADPSPTDPSTAGPSAGPSLARSFPAGSSLAGLSTAGPSITSDGPATAAGPATSTAGSSTWTGWAGEEITVIVLLSGDLATFWSQLYFTSGDVRWSGPFSTLSSSLMMMTGRRLSVGRCPRWRWLQGSAIAWRLAMMVSMRGRGRRTGVLRLGNAVGPWTTNRIHLSPGAGPIRRAWMGPLNLSSSAVMSRIWCLGESWRLSAPCLLFRSPLHNLWRSDPSEAGRPTTEMLEAMDFGSQDLEGRVADFSTSVALDPELVAVFVRFDPWLLALLEGSWRISSGAWILTELSMVSRSWDFCAAAAALRRFSCSLALACACQASSSQSLQTLHG